MCRERVEAGCIGVTLRAEGQRFRITAINSQGPTAACGDVSVGDELVEIDGTQLAVGSWHVFEYVVHVSATWYRLVGDGWLASCGCCHSRQIEIQYNGFFQGVQNIHIFYAYAFCNAACM